MWDTVKLVFLWIFLIFCGIFLLALVASNWPLEPVTWWMIAGFIIVCVISMELEKRKELAWQRHYDMTRQLGKIEEHLATLEYRIDDIRRRIPTKTT